jgi:hypothetical protein
VKAVAADNKVALDFLNVATFAIAQAWPVSQEPVQAHILAS